MTKVIFFDFWGTLVENGVFPSPVRNVKFILRIDLPFQDYVTKFEKAFMTQKFDNLKLAFENVAKEFDLTLDTEMMDRLVGLWNKNMLLAKPYPETMEVLENLKKKYKLVLIANSDPFSIGPTLEKFKMEKLFDKIILSCDFGYLKTDKELFEAALKKLRLKADDAVMVGDSPESDVNAATNAGIKAILVDRRNKREYTPKINALTELETQL
jgi:putative hydrolase of the HAD superfamily